jgi:hypothetical protein
MQSLEDLIVNVQTCYVCTTYENDKVGRLTHLNGPMSSIKSESDASPWRIADASGPLGLGTIKIVLLARWEGELHT